MVLYFIILVCLCVIDVVAFCSANAPRPTHWKYKIPMIGGILLLAKYGYSRNT